MFMNVLEDHSGSQKMEAVCPDGILGSHQSGYMASQHNTADKF
jgi:hypothetical protein